MKSLFYWMALSAISCMLVMSACTFTQSSPPAAEQVGLEFTSDYMCPMHCEGSGSDTAGSCPVCKMDYVQNDSQQQ